MTGLGRFDDYRRPVIAACCAVLGLPFDAVTETEPGRYAPAVAIDLYPFAGGNGTISYRSGAGLVMVRRGRVGRFGLDAALWEYPMRADDETVRAALAEAYNGLFGPERCENRAMTYPKIEDDSAPTMHPAVRQALRGLNCDHLPEDLRAVAEPFREVGLMMAEELPSDPEVTRGLHKLVEAKDCAVRAAVFNRGDS